MTFDGGMKKSRDQTQGIEEKTLIASIEKDIRGSVLGRGDEARLVAIAVEIMIWRSLTVQSLSTISQNRTLDQESELNPLSVHLWTSYQRRFNFLLTNYDDVEKEKE